MVYGLTKEQCLTVTPVLIHIGLHLLIPELNLSILDAGIMIMVQNVRLMMLSLNMMDYPM